MLSAIMTINLQSDVLHYFTEPAEQSFMEYFCADYHNKSGYTTQPILSTFDDEGMFIGTVF